MRFSKTKVVFFLTVIMATLLTACGGGSTGAGNNGKSTVTYLTWETTNTNAAIDAALAKFPDKNVTIQRIPSPNSDFDQKIKSLTLAKKLPDFFWCGNDTEQDLGSKGVLFDWSSYIHKNTSDFAASNFAPSALKAWYSPDGSKLYGLPTLMNTYGFFYNEDMFKAAGVPLPKVGWTYDDFFAAAKALTKKNGGKVTQYGSIGGPYSDPFAFGDYSVSAGGAPFTDRIVSPTKVTVSSQFAEGVQKFVDAIQNGSVTPPSFTTSNDPSAIFLAEKAPMIFNGQWLAASFLTSAPKFKYGFAPLPIVTGQVQPYDAVGICSPSYIQHPDAAWKVMTFLDAQAWKDILPGAPVAPAAYLPASSTYFDTLNAKGLQSVADSVKYVLNTPNKQSIRFISSWATKANDVITANWNDVIMGKKPVHPTLDTMAKQLNDVIQANQ